MAVTERTIHYHLASSDDLEKLLDELTSTDVSTVIVSTDEDAAFQLSELQLARLGASARDHGRRLVLEAPEGPLTDAAIALGFEDLRTPGEPPTDVDDDPELTAILDLMSESSRKRAGYFDTTADLATYVPEPPGRDAARNGQNGGHARTVTGTIVVDEDAAKRILTTAPPTAEPSVDRFSSRRPIPPAGPRRSARQEAPDQPRRRIRRSRSRRRRGVILSTAIVLPVIVLGVVAGLITYLLPQAEITLIPVEHSIAADLTYGVAIDGVAYDIVVDPVPISSRTSFEASAETTGERFEPDGTAYGAVLITNPFTNEVTVPRGTEFAGANGVTYYTYEDVVIPAADPFGSLSFGSSTAGVVAGIAGPAGNLDAGSLTGQLGIGLFYSNREPVTGGTNRRIAVVEADDVARVEQAVRDGLLTSAEAEFLASVPEDQQIVPGSIEIGEPVIAVSHEAGADATEISASGSITVRGRVFDPEALHARANDEAGRRLASEAGNDLILLATSVHINDPIALDEHGTAFVISAGATVRSVITAEEQAALTDQLVGLSLTDAEELLASHDKIARFEILLDPDWLPARLPEIASRISIEVTTGDAIRASR
jgi:hypothetical protein